MRGIEWMVAAVLAAALIGIAAALIYSRIWSVETAKPEFHRPLQRRANRDADERR
ncbi:hypothetical protein [Paraburkholderia caledonica]|uniref:hypothetical protein n=1 Tax=Paraburkholderia caledonica TaxID=134536 RepID=UPI0038BB86F9